MKSKQEKAVDYSTFALLSAWDTSISVPWMLQVSCLSLGRGLFGDMT